MPQRDYDRVELVWPGKRSDVERVRLPFQTIERVNDARRSREGQPDFGIDIDPKMGGVALLKIGRMAGSTV